MENMTIGDACYIFKYINEFSSEEECIQAIHRVLKMETRNSITKTDMMDVIRWLLERLEKERAK